MSSSVILYNHSIDSPLSTNIGILEELIDYALGYEKPLADKVNPGEFSLLYVSEDSRNRASEDLGDLCGGEQLVFVHGQRYKLII